MFVHKKMPSVIHAGHLGFDPKPVPKSRVVYKVAMGQGFLRVLQFSPVSIIPPMINTHLNLPVARN
jgi:hypothetical protein